MAHEKQDFNTRNALRVLGAGVLITFLFVGLSMGTVAAQEEVSNAQELQDIRDDLDGDYVLVDDVNLSSIGNFEPIGDFDDPFRGGFDGNGHNITGLTIVKPDRFDVGLFGAVGSGGTVEYVGLEEVNVDGERWTGGLVGFNQGEVISSYVVGDVFADRSVGALVGGNEGQITESDAVGTVTGNAETGGLVGINSDSGGVERSVAAVSVAGFEGFDHLDHGGLVGTNRGKVIESYAIGEVTGGDSAGGLVGGDLGGTIEESYVTGEVTGDSSVGALVGEMDSDGADTTLRDSYWDSQETTLSNAVGAGAGGSVVGEVEGLQTDEMQGVSAESSMSALDFTNTWETVTDPNSYPVLAWETADGEDTGDEDSDDDPPSDGVDIPDDFPDFQGSADVFSAIDGDGDGISPSEMSIAVGEFLSDGTVGGSDVSPAEMSQVVGWFLAQ